MKLATAQEVITRTNKGGITANNTEVVESALEAATVILESILGTPLNLRSMMDTYHYRPITWTRLQPFKLSLSQQFVDGTVKLYNTPTSNIPITSLEDATLVDTSLYSLNARRGVIDVYSALNYGHSSLVVTYDAGFEGTTVVGGTAVNDEYVPGWLKEAAISGAVFAMHQQSTAHSKKDAKDMSNPLYQFVYTQVSSQVFRTYNSLTPDISVEL